VAQAKKVLDQKRKREKSSEEPKLIRRSSRVKGDVAPNVYVTNDTGGKFTIGGTGTLESGGSDYSAVPAPEFYGNRVNDGADVSIYEGNEVEEGAEEERRRAVEEERGDIGRIMGTLAAATGGDKGKGKGKAKKAPKPSSSSSSLSSSSLVSKLSSVSISSEPLTAKVTPDRIYSIAVAPLPSKTLIAAGDKRGYLGIWDATTRAEDSIVCTWQPHRHQRGGQITQLQFTERCDLLSVSYDGTARLLDVEKGVFKSVFQAYDDEADEKYAASAGYGTLPGDGWMQFGVVPPSASDSLFMSTSKGGLIHYDMRSKTVAFSVQLSPKKINTVSVHPDNFTVATCGLENCVSLWDVRKFSAKGSKGKSGSAYKPVDRVDFVRSVTSAYFNKTGDKLLTTNMNDTLCVLPVASGGKLSGAGTSVAHDNQTGRWLTTFHAVWHPSRDVFACGSMKQPRGMDVFSCEALKGGGGGDGKVRISKAERVTGDVVTAVPSRVAWHENGEILVGGNASGRVVVADINR